MLGAIPRQRRRVRPLGACLASVALVAALVGCGPRTPERPNVLVIVVDTLRADHLTEYGYERETSAALADFLSHADRFERAYAPSSWTRPAIATLFSGLLPVRHQAKIGGTNRLNPGIVSLAEALSGVGYETAGYSFNVEITRNTGFDQGFQSFFDYQGGVLAYPDIAQMVEPAGEWLAEAERPFFLYLQPMNVHGPYQVPPTYLTKLLGYPPSREFGYRRPPLTAIMAGVLELRDQVRPSYLESLTDQYDTSISYTMDQLATLFQQLEESGEYDDTLIVLTSDHGEELFDHQGFSHAYTLYEEVVRVPLFVKRPGQRQGRTIDARVSLADLYPTILEVAGVPSEARIDGFSLVPILDDPSRAEGLDRDLIFELNNRKRSFGRGLISGRHKLIHIETDYQGNEDRMFLYDLEADPGELVDLAADEPELVAELRARMDAAFESYAAKALPLPEGPEAEIDEKTLRALGYL